ncbi:hypothetical protein LLS47_24015 [Rouxiella badensis]|uniref:hypothetical protein n=1 Tax=Rouxiella badensis TaxID=1646377 RepID=UPI001D14DB5A|nr:hypothetical protein [Rouxiella badensis]MCC3735963.1 hypothetical protein [Rouxiella badensis]MCC3761360.1 hypothetical protein [Rouxiella badensis]
MQYHEVVEAEIMSFVNENIEDFHVSENIYRKWKDTKHPEYPEITKILFFEIEFRKGLTLANTYNNIDEKYINERTLNYAINLCFNSEMSFKYSHDNELRECFSCAYYCIMENMYRTLSEKERGKVLWWID